MPPFALISFAPKTSPSVAGSEYGLETPTRSVMTPILMVSCPMAPAETSASAAAASNRLIAPPLSIQQILFAHPSYTKIDRLLQQLGLSLVVMRPALDHPEGLVLARCGVVNDARVRLGHGVVGRVLDRQQRHADRRGALRSEGVRVVDRPLRQPRAQGREASQADRPVVGGGRLAHVAPAGLAVVRVDRRVEEAQVGHRAVRDEAALHLVPLQPRQHLLYPGGAPPHPFQLFLSE